MKLKVRTIIITYYAIILTFNTLILIYNTSLVFVFFVDKVGSERFRAPEILFTLSLIDIEKPGMSDMVYNMIMEADMDTRNAYFKHIVLSGGSSMYPGLPTRLEKGINITFFLL